MSNINKSIAKCLIYAQIASDGGKRIFRLQTKDEDMSRHIYIVGYPTKDGYIKKAVDLIRSTKTNYHYWVEKAPDQNGNMSFIIYFDFKLDGERYQISFHSFNKSWESYLSSGRKTRWDKRKGGSAYAAKMLIDYYDL